jgi:hypothetical protein
MRKEAEKRELDPNQWFNNVEIVTAEKIRMETTTYVRNTFKCCAAYKLATEAHATFGAFDLTRTGWLPVSGNVSSLSEKVRSGSERGWRILGSSRRRPSTSHQTVSVRDAGVRSTCPARPRGRIRRRGCGRFGKCVPAGAGASTATGGASSAIGGLRDRPKLLLN